MKFAIAKTYGLTVLRGTLTYVKRMTKGKTTHTPYANDAILFDSAKEAIKFAKRKGWEVADHYIRSDLYVQEVGIDLLNGYQLRDNGENQLEKYKQVWV